MLFSQNLSKSKYVLLACLVFILSIAVASFLPLKYLTHEIWWFSAAIFFLALAILFWPNKIFLLAAVMFLAFWRFGFSLPESTPDKIWHYNLPDGQASGVNLTVRGYVSNEPDIRETNQKLEIAAVAVNQAPGEKISGKILATTNLFPEYKYGNELELECELKRPEVYEGFAYDRYLARHDIYSVCYYPKVKILPGNGGNIFYAKIFSFKEKMAGLVDVGLSDPEASLARPIVFGGQRGLERKIRDDFQKTGLTHIMAVSGFNVSILAVAVMAVLLGLGVSRSSAFYLAAALLAGYIVLVGLPASAARAGLMGFLVLWALKLGRLNKITNSLVLTAAIMLLINPKLLRDDVGFQLSFLALAGLVYVYPILEAVWQKIKLPKIKGVSDALLITMAAQVFTLPILAYNFSQISLIAPLANLAVLWVLPALTILILAALPLAALMPGLSFIFFLPSLLLTKYILFIVGLLARAPYAYLEVNYVSWAGVGVYYAVVVLIVIKLWQSKLLKPENNGKI